MKKMNLAQLRLEVESEIKRLNLSNEDKEKAAELNRLYVLAKHDESVSVEMMFTRVAALLSENYKELLEYYMNINFLSIIDETLEAEGECVYVEDEMGGSDWYYLQYEEGGDLTRYSVHYDSLDPYFDDDECCNKPFPDFLNEIF